MYLNLVHTNDMQVTLNMAKRLMDVPKEMSPGTSTILNNLFMAVSSHDGLASGV